MNKKYNEFAYYMGYITADEFYKIYDKFAKYLPDNIDYSNCKEDCEPLNDLFLELCIRKLTNNEDIYACNCNDNVYIIEGCRSIEEINKIQELLDKLGLIWNSPNKISELEFINDNI